MGTNVQTLPAAPTGPTASLFYPKLVQHKRSARNGHIPEAGFVKALKNAQNHVMAYRRKVFFTHADNANAIVAEDGVMFRFRCHTGHGARYMTFDMGMGQTIVDALGLARTSLDPRVTVSITKANESSAAHTGTIHLQFEDASGGTATDNPYQIQDRQCRIQVLPNQTYEVEVATYDYVCIRDIIAYEEAAPNVDPTLDYFTAPQEAAVGYPVFDSTRQRFLQGLSQIWRHNGCHLLTVPDLGGTSGVTVSSATFTNVLDDSTATPSASSPGFYLTGSPLLPLSRTSSSSKSVDVVFAVYGSADTNGGEVRLRSSSSTFASLTGMTSTLKWHYTPTTISFIDTNTKLDLQARATAGNVTVYAVSVYAYLA